MNRTEIRFQIRKGLGETTAAFWSDPELNSRIDEGVSKIAYATKCLRTNGYITTSSGTQEYTLTTSFSNLLSIVEVYYYQNATTWRELIPTTRDRLNIDHPGWLSASSATPIEYYWSREENLIGLFPKPDSTNAGTNYLRIYYAHDSTSLSTDSQSPSIPSSLHYAVVYYVQSICYQQRGNRDKEALSLQQYANELRNYVIERRREQEDDELIVRNYRNI